MLALTLHSPIVARINIFTSTVELILPSYTREEKEQVEVTGIVPRPAALLGRTLSISLVPRGHILI